MKVEGFFHSIKNANDTIKKLKESGFSKAYLDLNEHYIGERNVEQNVIGTENAVSLSDMVLGSGSPTLSDRGKAALAAASPMVSGFGNFDEIADINCKVIVETDDDSGDKARRIIEEMGGNLNSPNVKEPEIEGDADLVFDALLDNLRKNL
jgi:hypothetical protein